MYFRQLDGGIDAIIARILIPLFVAGIVFVINNDNWLIAKKGHVFMPEKERREIISSFPFVDKVVLSSHKPDDPERSVVRELKKLKPAIFANGGDRGHSELCPRRGRQAAPPSGARPGYGAARYARP